MCVFLRILIQFGLVSKINMLGNLNNNINVLNTKIYVKFTTLKLYEFNKFKFRYFFVT